MKWSLKELNQAIVEPISFNETLDLSSDLKELRPDLIDVKPVKVDGLFSVDELGVLGYYKVSCDLVLPSTRSFEPVEITLNFDVTEHYLSHHQPDMSEFENTDVVIILEDDILDLSKVIEDNILLQIPMQVLSAKEASSDQPLPNGDDWDVLTEDSKRENRTQTIDPRFAKLKDFFSEE